MTRFPLHPLGYEVATAFGDLVWWPFLRAVPLFLGFALDHFFVAGVLWGLIGAFWPDAARAYGVWFG